MRRILPVICLLLAAGVLASRPVQEKKEFSSYQELRQYLGELYQQKRYQEAVDLIEQVLDKFPDHVRANTYNLAIFYIQLENYEKAVWALQEGHRRGAFFGKWDFIAALWDPLRNLEGFQDVLEKNEALIAEAQSRAAMTLEVVTPEDYDPSQKYPLFIALHGGGGNIPEFKPNWISRRLSQEFIVAFVQSSQVATMEGFHWQDPSTTKKDLSEAYRQIIEQYPIDTDRVIVGGLSSGGYASLIVALQNTIPACGFVVLRPAFPEEVTEADIIEARDRGVRGTLITTENDQRIEQQKQLALLFKKHGLQYQFLVTPTTGLWFPENLPDLIDQAIAHTFNRV